MPDRDDVEILKLQMVPIFLKRDSKWSLGDTFTLVVLRTSLLSSPLSQLFLGEGDL